MTLCRPALFAALPFLSACGGGVGTVADVPFSALAIDDGTHESAAAAAEAGGFSGYMAGADGVVRAVTVELSDDQQTLTLTQDGLPPLVLTRSEGMDGDNDGLWGASWPYLLASDLNGSRVYLSGDLNGDGSNSVGYAGLFTPTGDLPTTDVGTYLGTWSATNPNVSGSGFMTMNVDFDTQTIDGTWEGSTLNTATFAFLSLSGGVSGTVDGNTVSGAMTDATNGTLDFGGAFYLGGTVLGGAIGGTVGGESIGGLWAAEDPPEP